MEPGGCPIAGARAPTPGGMPGGPSAPGGGAIASGVMAAAPGAGLRDRERDRERRPGEAARPTMLLSGAPSPIDRYIALCRSRLAIAYYELRRTCVYRCACARRSARAWDFWRDFARVRNFP
jgi:hypothetical protein